MINHAIILAGGNGTRFGALTKNQSKAMVSIGQSSLISFTLRQIVEIQNVFVTVGTFKEDIINYCYDSYNINNFIVTEKRGNSWWIFNSIVKTFDFPILVFPCDLIVNIDIQFLADEYLRLGEPPVMLVPVNPNDINTGDFIISSLDYRILRMEQSRDSNLLCSGIQIINPSKLNGILGGESIESFDLLYQVLIEKKLLYHCRTYPHNWFSINSLKEQDYYLRNISKFYF